MGRYLLRRAIEALIVVFLASIAIFLIIRLIPGDPAVQVAGVDATPEQVAEIREDLGLNRPLLTQYTSWMAGVFQFDFGKSFTKRVPVEDLIRQSFPPTLELAVAAYIFALIVGVPLGIAAAIWAGKAPDLLAGVYNLFTLGIILLWIFAVELDWFPVSGRVSITDDPLAAIHRLALPAMSLGAIIGAILARFIRASVAEVLAQDYIRTARAKGLQERVVVLRHALRNALIPVVTVVALQVGTVMAGAIVVEIVFTRPGFGLLMVDGITGRDYLLVQAMLAILVLIFVAANAAADIAYGFLDPRIRVGGAE